MKTYIIKWQGPYNDSEIESVDKRFGLYLITGYQKYKKTKMIQYCGITKQDFSKRLGNGHHKKDLVVRDREYWLGEIISDELVTSNDLELVESLIIYFWLPELNERKTQRKPKPTVIINRWYDKNENIRKRITHEAQKLDDVIFWDNEYWHLGNLKLYEFE